MVSDFPTGFETEPEEEGLQFYDEVFDELLKYGIEPVITLSHFEMPYELAKTNGGFMNRETVNHFVKFAEVCFKRYKSKVKYWMTFNEINNQMNYANDILVGQIQEFILETIRILKKQCIFVHTIPWLLQHWL